MAATNARNYLITGAGRGIGRGLSRLLLSHGHRVFLLDNNAEELDHTATVLTNHSKTPRQLRTALCDLSKPDQIASIVKDAATFFDSKIDVLINNAAHTAGVGSADVSKMSLDLWNTSLAVNLTAPMLMSQHCLPYMSKSSSRPAGGCIINMSSTRARQSEPANEAYAATKAGLLGLTQSMAVSLAPKGVRVNAILPGWIHVANECKAADEAGQSWEEGLSEAEHQWQLTGRVGNVEDVWRAVEYLVESSGVTGSELVVDGGVTRKMVYPE
ncbi:hypothetical protein LTR95_001133 [Oleoguttula sp. CCFEE 5521]